MELPVPPLAEQRAIVTFLDHETAHLDGLIERKNRLLDLLEEQRRAVISQAVTRGLNPDAPLKDSGVPWLGQVPIEWEVRELRHLINPQTSITYGIVQAGPDIVDGIPYIRTSDMSGRFLPRDGYQRTSLEIDSAYLRSKVKSGDVVVAIRASVGKSLIVPEYLDGANLTRGTAKISPSCDISGKFIVYALSATPSKQRFSAIAKGATFKEITLDMLRRFVIPVPSLSEQDNIVSYLDFETAKLDVLREKVEQSIAHLREYRAALITAAVTGQIDVREEATQA